MFYASLTVWNLFEEIRPCILFSSFKHGQITQTSRDISSRLFPFLIYHCYYLSWSSFFIKLLPGDLRASTKQSMVTPQLCSRTPPGRISARVLGVVTLKTFNWVKPIYPVQIHKKSPEVSSFLIWEGYTADMGSQGFRASWMFGP